MITALVASTLLSLAPDPSHLYDPPSALDIGLPPPCTDDTMCFSPDAPLCDVETGECVECLGPEHCAEGWACGPTGFCRDACEIDADCEGIGGQTLCDPETGFCVQCLDATDCVPEEYCSEEGFCRIDLCEPGKIVCRFGELVECTADGGPGAVLESCPDGCEVVEGTAQCVMPGGSSGGSAGTSGGEPGEGGNVGATMGMGSATGADASGSAATAIDDDDDGKGCACRAEPATGSAWAWAWWLALGTGLARRRRR
jgi:MYXO-CTERM domain-containing protein